MKTLPDHSVRYFILSSIIAGHVLAGCGGQSGDLDSLQQGSTTVSNVKITVSLFSAQGSFDSTTDDGSFDLFDVKFQRTDGIHPVEDVASGSYYKLTKDDQLRYLRYCVTPFSGTATKCSAWEQLVNTLVLFDQTGMSGNNVLLAYTKVKGGTCINLGGPGTVDFDNRTRALKINADLKETKPFFFTDPNCSGSSFSNDDFGSTLAGGSANLGNQIGSWASGSISSVKIYHDNVITATNLVINLSGSPVSPSYTFFDDQGVPEGASRFWWDRADDAAGTNAVAIGYDRLYKIQSFDKGHYIRFHVVPTNSFGFTGAGVISPWVQVPNVPTGTWYSLRAKHSGKFITVRDGSTANGTTLIQGGGGTDIARYIFEDAGEGYYYLLNRNSTKAISTGTILGDNTYQWDWVNGDDQKFWPIPDGNGYYNLKSKATGLCLVVEGAYFTDGAKIIQWPCQGNDNQKWSLDPVAIQGPPPLSGPAYNLINKRSNLLMVVEGASTSNGANIIQWSGGGGNERFSIEDAGGGYYLRNPLSNKCVSIGTSLGYGTNSYQWDCQSHLDQIYFIEDDGVGYYSLRNRYSLNCLDVSGGSTSNGGHVIEWPCTGADNQKWRLAAVP